LAIFELIDYEQKALTKVGAFFVSDSRKWYIKNCGLMLKEKYK